VQLSPSGANVDREIFSRSLVPNDKCLAAPYVRTLCDVGGGNRPKLVARKVKFRGTEFMQHDKVVGVCLGNELEEHPVEFPG
jgi:hypothetical protein